MASILGGEDSVTRNILVSAKGLLPRAEYHAKANSLALDSTTIRLTLAATRNHSRFKINFIGPKSGANFKAGKWTSILGPSGRYLECGFDLAMT